MIEMAILSGVIVCVLFLFSIFKETSKFSETVNRLIKIEHITHQMAVNFQIAQLENTFNSTLKEQADAFKMALEASGAKVFKSKDGKFTASSIEELFHKMSSDPRSNINPEDIDALRNFFEQILTEDSSDDIDEDEEF